MRTLAGVRGGGDGEDERVPKGGYVKKLSTHMGLMGTILTVAASPDTSICGWSSSFFPVRRSSFSFSSAKRQVTWAVWQSSTGE